MSLNDGCEPKRHVRIELQRLTDQFLEGGGQIDREGGDRVAITCTSCAYRQHVHVDFFLSFGRRCRRCGAETRVTC